MRVLLVGEESAGVRTFKLLGSLPCEVVAVCTGAERPGVRGATLADVARSAGVPVRPAREVTDAALGAWARREGVDLLLNVHALFRIAPEVLRSPRVGAFNLHPGPLPEYAGLNAVSWALYHGETTHAVTLHWIEDRIDRGDVAWAESFAIAANETALSLSARCLQLGLPLIRRLVETAARDPAAIPREAQDATRFRSFGREVPGDGAIDWRLDAARVVALVRACDYGPLPSPWGRARARWRGQAVEVLSAEVHAGGPGVAGGPAPGTVATAEDGGVLVAAGAGWVRLGRVALEGGVRQADAVFRAGDMIEGG